jgi:hypothetical protein
MQSSITHSYNVMLKMEKRNKLIYSIPTPIRHFKSRTTKPLSLAILPCLVCNHAFHLCDIVVASVVVPIILGALDSKCRCLGGVEDHLRMFCSTLNGVKAWGIHLWKINPYVDNLVFNQKV